MKRIFTLGALLGAVVICSGTMTAITSVQADTSEYTYTIQREVIRIVGRIRYEVMNNGGINWDENFQKMLAALPGYFRTFDDRAAERGCFLAPKITSDSNEKLLDALTEFAVQWVTQHSDPVKLEQVGYDR